MPAALVPVQVGILNVDGYYDCQLRLFDKGVEEGFIKPAARNIVISATTARWRNTPLCMNRWHHMIAGA